MRGKYILLDMTKYDFILYMPIAASRPWHPGLCLQSPRGVALQSTRRHQSLPNPSPLLQLLLPW